MEREVYQRMAGMDRDHWWFAGRRAILDRLIRRLVPLPSKALVLEVGCGTGANIPLLQSFGSVEAMEPDAEARQITTQRTGVAVKEGFLPDAIPFEDDQFDMIAMLDVLEHVDEDAATLRALKRKLKANGRLVVTVPACPWLWSSHDTVHHHKRRYTSADLRKLFEQNGYTLDYFSFYNSLLFPLVALIRGLGRLTGREGSDDAMPSAPINGVLRAIFSLERHVIGRLRLPFGVSLIAVARPK